MVQTQSDIQHISFSRFVMGGLFIVLLPALSVGMPYLCPTVVECNHLIDTEMEVSID